MNNFLASTVDFFLEDSELTSINSLQQSKFKSVISGSTYGLRIKLRRSTTGEKREDSIWQTPQEYFSSASADSFKFQWRPGPTINFTTDDYRMFTLNMYSRPSSFGPPLAGSGSYYIDNDGLGLGNELNFRYWTVGTSTTIGTVQKPRGWIYDGLYGFNVSHTPPYYNGEAWVDILYTPSISGQPTIDDIEANSQVVCWRIDGYNPDTWPSGIVTGKH